MRPRPAFVLMYAVINADLCEEIFWTHIFPAKCPIAAKKICVQKYFLILPA